MTIHRFFEQFMAPIRLHFPFRKMLNAALSKIALE